MLPFFKAGPDEARRDLTAVGSGQSCRPAVHDSQGVIVEYFRTAAMAIVRVQELEDPLVRARGLDNRALAGLLS